MNAVLAILKTHLVHIISGLVALLAIVFGVWGINAMSTVTAEMSKAKKTLDGLKQISGNLVNERVIAAAQERIDTIRANYQATLDWVASQNRYDQTYGFLVQGSFPTPDRDHKEAFKTRYEPKLQELLNLLKPGQVASNSDIADEKTAIQEESQEVDFGIDVEEAGGKDKPQKDQPLTTPSGLLTAAGARQNPAARANIRRAHEFYCYATLGALHKIDAVVNPPVGLFPHELDMWEAQLSLWIQEDVIRALGRLNNAKAQELQAQNVTPWVGILPVKELIQIDVTRYLLQGTTWSDPDSELYDSIDFTVKVVIDARVLPELINEIAKDRLHMLRRIHFTDASSDPFNWSMQGKIYGARPVINVELVFETVFLREVFAPLMPDSIREELELPPKETPPRT